jgi:bisphosphoglycerate-independent phosphoglycerate mutase (AlkP superfamily)
MQIYNIETKAIISGEEIKELDDCFILTTANERNDMQTTIRCLKPTWNKVICKETCLQRITSQLNQLTQNTVLGVDELSNNTDTLMMRITLKNVKNKSLLIYNKQNKTTYIDCWFISSRFLDQAIEDYLTNKED